MRGNSGYYYSIIHILHSAQDESSFFKKLIAGKSSTDKFSDMQKAIAEVGYTRYDIS